MTGKSVQLGLVWGFGLVQKFPVYHHDSFCYWLLTYLIIIINRDRRNGFRRARDKQRPQRETEQEEMEQEHRCVRLAIENIERQHRGNKAQVCETPHC